MPGKQDNNKKQQPSRKSKSKRRQNKQAQTPAKRRARAEMKKVRGNFGGLQTVAAVQALPFDYGAFRIPSPTPPRTSVLKFVDERPFSVTASANSFALITRSPTRQLWLTKTVSNTLAASSYFKRTYVSANKSMLPNNKGESLALAPLLQLDSTTATSWTLMSSSPEFLPNYPLAVDSNNGVWFYWPTGGSVFMFEMETTVNLSGGPCTWTFETCSNFASSNYKTFTVRGGTQNNIQSATLTSASFPTTHGFIRPVLITCNGDVTGDGELVEIRAGVTTNGSLLVPIAANSGGNVYTPTPFFDPPADVEVLKTATAPFGDTRVVASSVLFMNDTQELAKEGHVNGIHLNCKSSSNVFSPLFFSSYDTLYGMTHEKDKYGGKLAQGLYTFSRPDESSLAFRDWTSGTSTSYSVIRLDAFDFLDVVRFSDKNNQADTTMTAVVTYHIEWLNTSVLWPSGVQRMPYEAWRQAIASLAEIRPFTENPIHLRDVMRKIGQALRWAAPIVAPYAKDAAFALGRAALL